jgi:excisionase family DNA binding protein
MEGCMESRVKTWDELPEFMKVKEVAEHLDTSTNWVYEAATSGCLKGTATRLGRSIRIRKDALRQLLESGDLRAN